MYLRLYSSPPHPHETIEQRGCIEARHREQDEDDRRGRAGGARVVVCCALLQQLRADCPRLESGYFQWHASAGAAREKRSAAGATEEGCPGGNTFAGSAPSAGS